VIGGFIKELCLWGDSLLRFPHSGCNISTKITKDVNNIIPSTTLQYVEARRRAHFIDDALPIAHQDLLEECSAWINDFLAQLPVHVIGFFMEGGWGG